ncbi:MAG: hypothetical protein AAF968_02260 [Pseudomonadota bacterium]
MTDYKPSWHGDIQGAQAPQAVQPTRKVSEQDQRRFAELMQKATKEAKTSDSAKDDKTVGLSDSAAGEAVKASPKLDQPERPERTGAVDHVDRLDAGNLAERDKPIPNAAQDATAAGKTTDSDTQPPADVGILQDVQDDGVTQVAENDDVAETVQDDSSTQVVEDDSASEDADDFTMTADYVSTNVDDVSESADDATKDADDDSVKEDSGDDGEVAEVDDDDDGVKDEADDDEDSATKDVEDDRNTEDVQNDRSTQEVEQARAAEGLERQADLADRLDASRDDAQQAETADQQQDDTRTVAEAPLVDTQQVDDGGRAAAEARAQETKAAAEQAQDHARAHAAELRSGEDRGSLRDRRDERDSRDDDVAVGAAQAARAMGSFGITGNNFAPTTLETSEAPPPPREIPEEIAEIIDRITIQRSDPLGSLDGADGQISITLDDGVLGGSTVTFGTSGDLAEVRMDMADTDAGDFVVEHAEEMAGRLSEALGLQVNLSIANPENWDHPQTFTSRVRGLAETAPLGGVSGPAAAGPATADERNIVGGTDAGAGADAGGTGPDA